MVPTPILDEGIERTLDLIQSAAGINAVMPYSHAYNGALIKALRDRADHGVPLTDNTGRKFPLVWVKTHDQYTRTPRSGTRSSTTRSSITRATCSQSWWSRRASAA